MHSILLTLTLLPVRLTVPVPVRAPVREILPVTSKPQEKTKLMVTLTFLIHILYIAAMANEPTDADMAAVTEAAEVSSGTAASPSSTDNNASILGSVFKQCSTARLAASTLSVTEITNGTFTTISAAAPQVGRLDWEEDMSVLKTFHGGRVSKAGRTVNECMASSFDPRNLHCVSCDTQHHILNPLKTPVIILADQNFMPHLSGGPENCVAVVRAENPTLNELADLAAEIFEKTHLPAGTVLMFGSGSHLFKVGASQYATDWINLRNRCSQKWPGTNICPLVPIVRSDCPGSMARDISVLGAWLGKVYADNASGLIDVWKSLMTYTESQCEGNAVADVLKIPLPASISAGSVQTHCFVLNSSCPVVLPGINRKATEELLRVLIESLNRDFNTNLNPEVIILNSWACIPETKETEPDMEAAQPKNHVVLIGASNMRRIIPFLKQAGHSVTDLTQPSWLATPDNIDYLISQLNTIVPDPDTTVVLELFANSTFRYRQFDGTMALPFKSNNGYHMEGAVGVCDDETFLKLCGSVSGVFDACNDSTKLIIPPLPRYLYTGCCGNKHHCTNRKNEEYELSLLHATTHFRPVLKEALLKQGLDKFFVIDGIGALLGVLPGGNRGAPAEIVRELTGFCATDGVHFTDTGYANFAKTVIAAAKGVRDGTLTKSNSVNPVSGRISGTSYFWRGFVSPVGARLSTHAPILPKEQPRQLGYGPSHGYGSSHGYGPASTPPRGGRGGPRGGPRDQRPPPRGGPRGGRYHRHHHPYW
jgi:hypothetical protein